MLGHRSG
jgi:hypothetical protein